MEYQYARAKPRFFQKWWMKCRKFPVKELVDERGRVWQQGIEIYVPWWAWPLELTHRVIFGNPKLEKVNYE